MKRFFSILLLALVIASSATRAADHSGHRGLESAEHNGAAGEALRDFGLA
jgi:hypothetical protein